MAATIGKLTTSRFSKVLAHRIIAHYYYNSERETVSEKRKHVLPEKET
jgi:hypothetical protein